MSKLDVDCQRELIMVLSTCFPYRGAEYCIVITLYCIPIAILQLLGLQPRPQLLMFFPQYIAQYFNIFFMKFQTKAIAATFFEKVSCQEKGGKVVTTFKCQCGILRSQNLSNGYQNLISHIKDQHPDWEGIMLSKQSEASRPITQFVNKKANTIYSWLDWVIMKNLAFVFVEDTTTRKYTKLDSISVDTLIKYVKLLTKEVEKKVAANLPDQFGVVIDGWSEGTT
jgi:hypothetical protein